MFDLTNRTKPILKWAGGKANVLPQMVSHFPTAFDRYVEPFLGGGAVFFALQPGGAALLNDSNEALIELYEVIRDQPRPLMHALDALKSRYSEKFYYRLRKQVPRSELERAARLLFLNKTCFNGLYRLNAGGQFNVPFGKRVRCPELYDAENFIEASRRLKSATLQCKDFESLLAETGAGDFVYCDPPYLPISKTASFSGYTRFGFTLKAHEALKKACLAASRRGAFVALSNSCSPLSLKIFHGQRKISIRAKRAINCKGNRRGWIQEYLFLVKPKKIKAAHPE